MLKIKLSRWLSVFWLLCEFAARGGILSESNQGRGQDFYFSNGNDGFNVWRAGTSGGRTHPVAQFSANALGLYDMSGNIWEWTWNWFGSPIGSGGTDPVGPATGSIRIRRGGSWSSITGNTRVSNHDVHTPTGRNYNFGFRLASSSVE